MLVSESFLTWFLVREFGLDLPGIIPTQTWSHLFLQGNLFLLVGNIFRGLILGTEVAHYYWVGNCFLTFSVHEACKYILYFQKMHIIGLHHGLLLYFLISNHSCQFF